MLRDGSTVHVRPVRPDDREALKKFLARLSPESRSLRFFSLGVNLDGAAEWAADVDYERPLRARRARRPAAGDRRARDASAATTRTTTAPRWRSRSPTSTRAAGSARSCSRTSPRRRRSGACRCSRPRCSRTTTGWSRCSGRAASRCGCAPSPDVLRVEFPTALSDEALERFDERERTAAAAALRRFLQPGSVAVIGASRERGTVGGEVFHNLLATAFNGPVYPGQPARAGRAVRARLPVGARHPGRRRAWRSCRCRPRSSRTSPGSARPRASGALVVISAGFAETGEEGRARQDELLGVCREAGMRLIGPELPRHPEHRARRAAERDVRPALPASGNVGFLSQSGALGLAVIDYASELGLGLSSFVSVGQQGRHLGQRPAPVLGGRRRHRRDPALPRVVRQPAQVRADRPPGRAPQADRRRQERPLERRARAPRRRTPAR